MKENGSGLSARWRAVKSQKANLALLIIGLALIILSPLWRFAVAPAIKIVATDFDRISFYGGTLTTYVRPPGQPPVGPRPASTAVTVQARYSNPVGKSTPDVAVLQVDTALINTLDRVRLSEVRHTYAIDRRTARQVPDHGADLNRTGYYYVFPFDTPKTDIEVWDNLSAAPQKAVFARANQDNGVKSYAFNVQYSGRPVPAPAGFPTQITGAQLRSIVPAVDPAIADSDALKVGYRGSLTTEFLVEPIGGTEVGIPSSQESVFMTVDDPQRGLSFTQVIYKLDYKENPSSLQDGAAFAKDEIAKIKLQFTYLPLVYLVLGIASVLIGLFARTVEDDDEPAVAEG
ncbi:MAG: porin PorA family protein [Candidatus Geothermincolia bacterium]